MEIDLEQQRVSVVEKQDADKIAATCGQDACNKKEVEKEVEVEIEVKKEKDKEKESLYTDGVCVFGDTDTDRFETFWNLYPMKLGKQKAWEAWQAVKPDLDKVVSALECWTTSSSARRGSGRSSTMTSV